MWQSIHSLKLTVRSPLKIAEFGDFVFQPSIFQGLCQFEGVYHKRWRWLGCGKNASHQTLFWNLSLEGLETCIHDTLIFELPLVLLGISWKDSSNLFWPQFSMELPWRFRQPQNPTVQPHAHLALERIQNILANKGISTQMGLLVSLRASSNDGNWYGTFIKNSEFCQVFMFHVHPASHFFAWLSYRKQGCAATLLKWRRFSSFFPIAFTWWPNCLAASSNWLGPLVNFTTCWVQYSVLKEQLESGNMSQELKHPTMSWLGLLALPYWKTFSIQLCFWHSYGSMVPVYHSPWALPINKKDWNRASLLRMK